MTTIQDQTYTVTYSRTGDNREIGTFDTLADAKAAARTAGAIIPRAKPCVGVGLDVRGHQRDDHYGIWIESSRGDAQ